MSACVCKSTSHFITSLGLHFFISKTEASGAPLGAMPSTQRYSTREGTALGRHQGQKDNTDMPRRPATESPHRRLYTTCQAGTQAPFDLHAKEGTPGLQRRPRKAAQRGAWAWRRRLLCASVWTKTQCLGAVRDQAVPRAANLCSGQRVLGSNSTSTINFF